MKKINLYAKSKKITISNGTIQSENIASNLPFHMEQLMIQTDFFDTKECKQQFTLRITQANSTQLIVILYEMTLQYLADGEQAADDAGLAEAVHRARGCIKELLNSLHREYSPAGELSRLYLFCLRRLAVCEVRRDRTILEEIRKVIAPLCDAYRQIQDQDTSGPVMNNSQTVYAGLTYGRNQLTENMADQGTNRGMLV